MNYLRLLLAAVAALVALIAWGFLTEGWLIRKDFTSSAALYRTADLQMKYMPFGLVTTLVALLAAVFLYAGWCGGTSGAVRGLQFGLIMGVFVACIHPISNLVTMNMDMKLGLEIAACNAIGWVLAGVVIGLVYKPPAYLSATTHRSAPWL
jgi:ABC-type multidrug transport system permease subunit